MATVNSKGEIADFVNESQFEGGETAYACVSFSASLVFYAGQPGHGPTGTGEQVDQLADKFYGAAEGSYAASNTNGMSLDAEYMMLRGMGMRFYPLPITAQSAHDSDIATIKAWLRVGFPVLICGAETGMFDMDLGDVTPYAWPPSGNHAIVACGVASDGNLLVRDAASIDKKTGLRPGPRPYDSAKLQLISGTALQVPWLPNVPTGFDPTKEDMVIPLDINMPEVAKLFKQLSPSAWQSIATGCVIHDGFLHDYVANGQASLDYLGDVVQNEQPQGNGRSMQRYAKGVRYYDNNVVSSLPIYGKTGEHPPGEDPLVVKLEAQITALQAQPAAPQLTAVVIQAATMLAESVGKKVV